MLYHKSGHLDGYGCPGWICGTIIGYPYYETYPIQDVFKSQLGCNNQVHNILLSVYTVLYVNIIEVPIYKNVILMLFFYYIYTLQYPAIINAV